MITKFTGTFAINKDKKGYQKAFGIILDCVNSSSLKLSALSVNNNVLASSDTQVNKV